MADETVVVAESSTANEIPSVAPTNAQDYANWRMTGELPKSAAKPKTEATAASDSSKETHSDATKTDGKTAAESETAKHQESGKGKDAESRIKQLIAEKKELERQLNEGKKPEAHQDAKPAESQTAKPKETPQKLEAPKKPKLDDFNTYQEYEAARDEYFEKLADFKSAASASFAMKINDLYAILD